VSTVIGVEITLNLPIRPEQLPGHWEVFSEYGIHNGEVISWGADWSERYYRPQDHPELPFEIAKLDGADDASIVRFLKQWGTLGRVDLLRTLRYKARLAFPSGIEPFADLGGEPVLWIRMHALNLAACIAFGDALRRMDADAAGRELIRFLSARVDLHGREARWGWETILRTRFFVEDSPPEADPVNRAAREVPLDAARLVLDMYVNEMIEGIGPRLQLDSGNEPALEFSFDAMIQVAYLHLAHSIVENSSIDNCEECGRPFKKTDGRQRFCPKGPFQSESTCGYRARYRRFKKGAQNG
jgi:hypothetical protein